MIYYVASRKTYQIREDNLSIVTSDRYSWHIPYIVIFSDNSHFTTPWGWRLTSNTLNSRKNGKNIQSFASYSGMLRGRFGICGTILWLHSKKNGTVIVWVKWQWVNLIMCSATTQHDGMLDNHVIRQSQITIDSGLLVVNSLSARHQAAAAEAAD